MQRAHDAVFRLGARAGPEVRKVVGVAPVGDVLQAVDLGYMSEQPEELAFAVVAAIRGVLRETRIGQLVRLDLYEIEAELLGERAGLDDLGLGIRVRGCQHGLAPVAEDRVSAKRQQCRVHAARVCDEHAAQLLEPRQQCVVVLLSVHVQAPVLTTT